MENHTANGTSAFAFHSLSHSLVRSFVHLFIRSLPFCRYQRQFLISRCWLMVLIKKCHDSSWISVFHLYNTLHPCPQRAPRCKCAH